VLDGLVFVVLGWFRVVCVRRVFFVLLVVVVRVRWVFVIVLLVVVVVDGFWFFLYRI
jgi:hypothetical protein